MPKSELYPSSKFTLKLTKTLSCSIGRILGVRSQAFWPASSHPVNCTETARSTTLASDQWLMNVDTVSWNTWWIGGLIYSKSYLKHIWLHWPTRRLLLSNLSLIELNLKFQTFSLECAFLKPTLSLGWVHSNFFMHSVFIVIFRISTVNQNPETFFNGIIKISNG